MNNAHLKRITESVETGKQKVEFKLHWLGDPCSPRKFELVLETIHNEQKISFNVPLDENVYANENTGEPERQVYVNTKSTEGNRFTYNDRKHKYPDYYYTLDEVSDDKDDIASPVIKLEKSMLQSLGYDTYYELVMKKLNMDNVVEIWEENTDRNFYNLKYQRDSENNLVGVH